MARLRDHSEVARSKAVDIGRPTEISQGPTSASAPPRRRARRHRCRRADAAASRRSAASQASGTRRTAPSRCCARGCGRPAMRSVTTDPAASVTDVERVLQRLEIHEHASAPIVRRLSSRTGYPSDGVVGSGWPATGGIERAIGARKRAGRPLTSRAPARRCIRRAAISSPLAETIRGAGWPSDPPSRGRTVAASRRHRACDGRIVCQSCVPACRARRCRDRRRRRSSAPRSAACSRARCSVRGASPARPDAAASNGNQQQREWPETAGDEAAAPRNVRIECRRW